jgi:uncharacterized cofD-like protein
LSVSLRAAAHYAGTLTGIVSVADDGGSSGLLRAAVPDLPAVGDLRRCLSSLAPADTPLARAMEHRFGPELQGHAVGNLVLAGLVAELGDLTAAVDELARLLGVDGRIIPATTLAVDLHGVAGSTSLRGQVAVQEASGIDRVWLEPERPECHQEALAAVRAADQIVLGPGSLYTSVLAALVVPDLREAVADSKARTVYVANLAPQAYETVGYDLAAHLRALDAHGVSPDVVVYEPGSLGPVPEGVEIAEARLARPNGHTHDPDLLAAVLRGLL